MNRQWVLQCVIEKETTEWWKQFALKQNLETSYNCAKWCSATTYQKVNSYNVSTSRNAQGGGGEGRGWVTMSTPMIKKNTGLKSITRSLIIFKKPRKMTNGFFNNSSKLPLDIMKKFFNLGFLAESVKVNTN